MLLQNIALKKRQIFILHTIDKLHCMCVCFLLPNLYYACFFSLPVDKNGDVCISILHEPGEDKYGYEKPEERWLPIHTVETIMISVISMLADPNGDSPANVDAAVSLL